ncbi:MAG: hypothetical protein HY841_01845 [Bacteroidetes bacterium]|nr:hypothetical protein [Bacteroidota bacterium]
MKKLFLCSTLIFISLFCFAQQKDSANIDSAFLKNETGIDMVFFLNLMRNQWEPSNTTLFVFSYDRWLSQKNALRFTWGIGYYNIEGKQDTFPLLKNENSNNFLKAGFNREQRIDKRWLFYYGSDLVYAFGVIKYQLGNLTSGVITTTEKNKYYGPSPFMGIRFEVNPHISFTTETYANLFFVNKENRQVNDKFPEQNTSSETTGFSIAYFIPQNIFRKEPCAKSAGRYYFIFHNSKSFNCLTSL